MCGFVGYLDSKNLSDDIFKKTILKNMADRVFKRGPDDFGVWSEPFIGFAHRRLAILDLTEAGHQPMLSISGRFSIVYNGEIYNHLDIRSEIESVFDAVPWNGGSDTETLLKSFDVWGIKDTIKRCIGMFSIAIWDRIAKKLTLVRDRIGEKPLYYGWQGNSFLFGSDLASFKMHPEFSGVIDRKSLKLMMRYGYVPSPYSIYEGIAKLQPGCLLTVSAEHDSPVIEKYWSIDDCASSGVIKPIESSPTAIVDELDKLLRDAVSKQMLADVPVGAFLSGGIDSSTILALMQSQSTTPVKSFSIGFNESGYDEAVYAREVAKHLGTDHVELYVTSRDARDVIPILPEIYSEPFADSSQIPTFLVSKLAKSHVKVALSGDAGDELFCGYSRYTFARKFWGGASKIPLPIRSLIAGFGGRASPASLNKLFKLVKPFFPSGMHVSDFGDKALKALMVLPSSSVDDVYSRLITLWSDDLVIGGDSEVGLDFLEHAAHLESLDEVQRMMLKDSKYYLPDDILVKVDRASMGVSLEARVPFLDHRIVEFAWRIPQSVKVNNGLSKWPLREILYRHVPKELIDRPKMGFGVPIDSWLRNELRDWAEALLDEKRLKDEGFFNSHLVRKRWLEHISGVRNWQHQLWCVLMFQAWFEKQ